MTTQQQTEMDYRHSDEMIAKAMQFEASRWSDIALMICITMVVSIFICASTYYCSMPPQVDHQRQLEVLADTKVKMVCIKSGGD